MLPGREEEWDGLSRPSWSRWRVVWMGRGKNGMGIGIRFVMVGRRGRWSFEDLDVGVMDEEHGIA